jgi:hypothetical protein
LRKAACQKSKEWRTEVSFRIALQYFDNDVYRKLDEFFSNFGYVICPYVYNEPHTLVRKFSLGFFDEITPKVLYVNGIFFNEPHCNDPINSPLNIAFHEFLHAICLTHKVQYNILLTCINYNDMKTFVTKAEAKHKLESIYGSEADLANEYLHRFIANNINTTPLLQALYRNDDTYKPQRQYVILYRQLKNLLNSMR